MEKRNAIAVAASVALVSLAGAATIATTLADRGAGDDPAPAVTAATVPATPVLTPVASATDDRDSSDDDRVLDGDHGSDDDHGHGRGRGRGRGGDDD